MKELERQMKPSEMLKEISSTVAVYPVEQKARIDHLLVLDQVRCYWFHCKVTTLLLSCPGTPVMQCLIEYRM